MIYRKKPSSHAVLPAPWISAAVSTSQYDNLSIGRDVHQTMREAPQTCSTHLLVHDLILKWISLYHGQRRRDRLEKVSTEPWILQVIPT